MLKKEVTLVTNNYKRIILLHFLNKNLYIYIYNQCISVDVEIILLTKKVRRRKIKNEF